MKVGTIMHCKKTLTYKNVTFHIENKSYRIVSKLNSFIFIKSEDSRPIEYDTAIENLDEFKLNDYFMTEKDYRKQKLSNLAKLAETK